MTWFQNLGNFNTIYLIQSICSGNNYSNKKPITGLFYYGVQAVKSIPLFKVDILFALLHRWISQGLGCRRGITTSTRLPMQRYAATAKYRSQKLKSFSGAD